MFNQLVWLESEAYILLWLNARKRQLVAAEAVPISDCPWGKNDDFSNGGCKFEYPVRALQFLASDGSGSVVSTDPDDEKRGALIHMECGERILWAREGEEQILEIIEHDFRLFSVQVNVSEDWVPNELRY